MNGVITKIRMELLGAFNQLFDVFAIREDVLYYKPANDGWSMYQVLEHVLLANHFLLRMVNKQTERALQLANLPARAQMTKDYVLDVSKLKKMELTGSYLWVPQRYTEPSGDIPMLQLKMTLHDQLNECLKLLHNKSSLEAIISTHQPGNIDALHYLYLLAQHIQRHLQQVQRIKLEFNQLQRQTYSKATGVTTSFCLN